MDRALSHELSPFVDDKAFAYYGRIVLKEQADGNYGFSVLNGMSEATVDDT